MKNTELDKGLFSKLLDVKSYSFSSTSGELSKVSWSGKGHGSVVSSEFDKNTIIFKEDGVFHIDISNKKTTTTNQYIWRRNSDNNLISLSHNRLGYSHEVKLFDIFESSNNIWISTDNHICGKDSYSSKITIREYFIEMVWDITGPKKQETILYNYYFNGKN